MVEKKLKILKSKQERKKVPAKKDITKAVIAILAVLIASALLINPIRSFLNEDNRIQIKSDIEEEGFFGILKYVVFVALQTFLSVIPGQIGFIFGGYAFGPYFGTMYSIIGVLAGSAISYYIGKKFGRPILEDFLEKKALEKFDKKTEEKGLIALFFIFLLPFTPDSAFCMLTGTTKISLKNMLIVSAIGRLPGIFLASMVGAGIDKDFSGVAITIIVLISILLALAYWNKEKLERETYSFAKRFDSKSKK